MDWGSAVAALRNWHQRRSRSAARSALEFLEPQLRLQVPPLVRRTWPSELVEDALRGFLTRLLERPLPDEIDSPRRYLTSAFRNRLIDLHRAQQRRNEVPPPEDSDWPPGEEESPEMRIEREQQASELATALASLSMADRVALKLVDAPEWLSSEEVAWLAAKSGSTHQGVVEAIDSARDVHDLTLIFDPKGSVDDSRRLRMERFRRRRARARAKARDALSEGGER